VDFHLIHFVRLISFTSLNFSCIFSILSFTFWVDRVAFCMRFILTCIFSKSVSLNCRSSNRRQDVSTSLALVCAHGEQVGGSGTHGLACRKSAGRHVRHNAVNDLIKRTLVSANVPAMLESTWLCRDDGKLSGRILCCHGLTVDTSCGILLALTSELSWTSPGAVANDAENR
jgi:hypothetical protein